MSWRRFKVMIGLTKSLAAASTIDARCCELDLVEPDEIAHHQRGALPSSDVAAVVTWAREAIG